MIGQSVGSDASPLSCFLFRPRKSREKRRKRSHINASNASVTRTSTPPAQTAHVRFRGRKRVHTRLRQQDRTQGFTRRNRGVSDGGGITTLGAFRTFTNIPGPGVRTANFAAFGSWPGVRSRRTQRACGAAMRLCASLSRGVAAPLGCVILFLLSKLWLVCHALRVFPRVRGEGWYHYPQRALRAAETPDTRLSKRLICRFLRSGGRSSPHDSYFLANTQNFLLAVPVANTFALWYNKSKELEEFQNNYAVKFPFAIASSSPGPRPKQQKGSAIP